jgi:hypothetical protein
VLLYVTQFIDRIGQDAAKDFPLAGRYAKKGPV